MPSPPPDSCKMSYQKLRNSDPSLFEDLEKKHPALAEGGVYRI
jgi:hypothetical protein